MALPKTVRFDSWLARSELPEPAQNHISAWSTKSDHESWKQPAFHSPLNRGGSRPTATLHFWGGKTFLTKGRKGGYANITTWKCHVRVGDAVEKLCNLKSGLFGPGSPRGFKTCTGLLKPEN